MNQSFEMLPFGGAGEQEGEMEQERFVARVGLGGGRGYGGGHGYGRGYGGAHVARAAHFGGRPGYGRALAGARPGYGQHRGVFHQGGYGAQHQGGYRGRVEAGYRARAESGYRARGEPGYRGRAEPYRARVEAGYRGGRGQVAYPGHVRTAGYRYAEHRPGYRIGHMAGAGWPRGYAGYRGPHMGRYYGAMPLLPFPAPVETVEPVAPVVAVDAEPVVDVPPPDAVVAVPTGDAPDASAATQDPSSQQEFGFHGGGFHGGGLHGIGCNCQRCRRGGFEVLPFGVSSAPRSGQAARASGGLPFSPSAEHQLTMELLSVSNEAELEQFLGGMFKGIWKGIKKVAAPLGGALKAVAKTALPFVGGALGSMIPIPGVGTALGTALGGAVSKALEMEFEGLHPEQQEFEVARRFVRMAGTAAQLAGQGDGSAEAVRAALHEAARRHAPYLEPVATQAGRARPQPDAQGQWRRHGGRIILHGDDGGGR